MKLFYRSLVNSAVLFTLPLASQFSYAQSFADSAKQNNNKSMEVIEVQGELLPTNAKSAANSVDVVNSEYMEQLGAAHIQDVLQQVGNVNYSSGSSRARFFQIRGIGERSQFVDPVNPSVGVAIDGIDYTGIGSAATLFDIDQVEVFKGPQGTSIGANAMAGFINLNSTPAGSEQINKARLELGNYGLQHVAAAFGGDVNKDVKFRVSASKLQGDGYIENTFLNRKDTNGFDELAIRAAIDANVSDDYQISAEVHKFDIDNGYDAFSLNLDRTTLSDEPGFDRQDTTAFAITQKYSGLNSADVKLFVSVSDSDLAYGYDEDWSYVGIAPGWEYSSTDHYYRERGANQIDFSVSGKDKNWVVGFYRQGKETDLTREYTWLSGDFTSVYDVVNSALYGESRYQLTKEITVSAGLRVEQYDGDYSDSNAVSRGTKETMIGGHFSASKQYNDEFMSYFRISRGFKAGGVNGEALAGVAGVDDIDLQQELLNNGEFDSETLDNIELGLRYSSEKYALNADANLFYATRSDMQVKQWITNEGQVSGDEPPVFIGYLSNAPSGANYGFETNLSYQLTSDVRIYGTYAVLETEVNDFYRLSEDDDGNEFRLSLDGRKQAHAPDFQYTLGADWFLTNELMLNVNMNGRGEYYYSYSHDESADSVNLLNASLTYKGDKFDVTLWARNMTDEEYGVRGFYFGNDPRDEYVAKNWEQFGEPAVFGVKIDYVF
ncbi:MAG: TonB-dependent receptor [Gammaproteobacteria bacterium]|nr:TonB-dependent receptor [Gammaproteobacteria bacterium]